MKRQKKRPANQQAERPAVSARKPGAGAVEAAKENHEIPGFLPSSWHHDWLLGLFLLLATIIAYHPAWHGGLIWDDDKYVTEPGLRSLNGLARIWIQLGATLQYYPFVYSVFWAEHRLWGDATAGYHWANILLHVFSALLLVKILRQLKIPGAWLAAALFALHPVEVESVAWITELKNTLSGVFYLSAALAYLGFDRKRKRGNYVAALTLFAFGLMSKTVVSSLPAALLVIFWWQRGKLSWKRDALPLLPFFIAGIGFGLLTAWMERTFIGAKGSEFNFSIIERFLIAGRDIWFYLGKLIWPVDLAFIYPRWNVSQAVWWQYLFPAAALLLFGVLVWRRWRGPLAGLLFFVGTLFPALGFFNVYPFRYSLVADHFQYLASLGPLTLAAVGITMVSGLNGRRRPFLGLALCATLLLILGTLTWRQCGMYADVKTLWQTTIRLNPECWMAYNNLGLIHRQEGKMDEAMAQFQKALAINLGNAETHNNLGSALLQQGQVDEAMAQFRKALEIKPDYAASYNNLGNALLQKGRVDEAISHFQHALQIEPDFAEAHYNLGNALRQKGNMDEAVAHYQKSLEIDPDNAEVHNNLANALMQNGQTDEAIAHFRKAMEIKPDYAEACYNLGNALMQKGNVSEAAALFEKAVEIKPDYAAAHNNLGNALMQKGNVAEAIAHFQSALQFDPANPTIQINLAWLLATCPEASLRDGPKAVELAQQANATTGGANPMILHTLAAAFAEAGQFGDARKNVQKAIELASASGRKDMVEHFNGELKRYDAGLPLPR